MRNQGMSLLEVMMAVALFTIVMGAIFGLSLSFGDTARVQNVKALSNDEALRAFQSAIPLLCEAAKSSITWDTLPADVLSFQTASDVDGNGSAVGIDGKLELSGIKTIQRDVNDANADGQTNTQLVLIEGESVRVLANNLIPASESPDAEGNFGSEQDTNGNGVLDRGFWVEPQNGGLMIHLDVQGQTRRGNILISHFEEFVEPRN